MIFPAFQWFGDRTPLPAAARMIREHSAWLTRMFNQRGKAAVAPRIPVRRVSEGGFSNMMATPSGRARAARWWDRTLDRMDD